MQLKELKTKKINYLEKKIPDATTLIQINQYYTIKQNLEKNWDGDKKISDTSDLVTTTVLDSWVKLKIKFLIVLNILLLNNLIS